MTLSNTFTESFVRGMGNSSASLLVIGAVAGVYYVATNIMLFTRKKKVIQHDKEVQVASEALEFDPNLQALYCDENQITKLENGVELVTNYAALFDSLRPR